jgi:hypothetical protein
MNANELRIGNYIYNGFIKMNGFPNYTHKVTCLNLIGETQIFSCDINSEFDNNLKNLIPEPIPISEEWLLKFGFVEQSYINYFKKNDITISKDDNYYECFLGVFGTKEIKYIHQLQNLYFALTGEELTLLK